ncbi:hypothetical protein GGQ74_002923 [Desulfobaculum xiamenense]|uniref:D-glucuronyl C5-epimerase C-terminal domain-containing protein n=1 Tax=Desulfobaculum xiamenense TaxID=995050 RepID=A0A846QJZ7_9BACT|nr:D-glucuronyl C5-epimerase family protein [Desulfobaculum xiamenense]NJB69226.1 hypothetical protein [Desulfobaculum xiamenense]
MILGFNASFDPGYAIALRPHDAPGYPLVADGLWGVTPSGHGLRLRMQNGALERHYPGIGWRVNPAHTAWWGLVNLTIGLSRGDAEALDRTRAAVAWLAANAREHNGFPAWTYDFDWSHMGMTLRAPWASALAQGLGASLLFRAARAAGMPDHTALAIRALDALRIDLREGGLRTELHGTLCFEEYPTPEPTVVLDGFLFALVACADLAHTTGDSSLLDDGIAGLARLLPVWDWRGRWSRYGAHGPLCSLEYHQLNHALLITLDAIAPGHGLGSVAEGWTRHRTSPALRAAILAAYYTTNVRHTLGPGGGLAAFALRKLREMRPPAAKEDIA